MLRIPGKLTKSVLRDDGSLEIEGIFTTDELDKGGDIVPIEVTKAAVARWEARNLREMHDETRAVGKAEEVWYAEEDGRQVGRLRGFVSAAEPGTIRKVQDGTLSYFSIAAPKANFASEFVKLEGGKRARRITSYDLAEVSLVDNAMNASARLEFARAVGLEDEPAEEAAEETATGKPTFRSALLKAVADVAPAGEPVAAPPADPPAAPEPAPTDEPRPFVLTAEQAASLGITLSEGETYEVRPVKAVKGDAVAKREFSAEERREMASKGAAMRDGSYPTPDLESFHDAVSSLGRAKSHGNYAAIKRYLRKRCKSMGWDMPEALKAMSADGFRKCCGEVPYVQTCYLCGCQCGAMDATCEHSCCCGEGADMVQAVSLLVSIERLRAREMDEANEGDAETPSLAALREMEDACKRFLSAEAAELLAESAEETPEEKAARVAMVKSFAFGGALGAHLARLEKRLVPAPVMPSLPPVTLSDDDVSRIALALAKSAPASLTAEDGDALGSALVATREGVLKAVAEVERKLGAIGETVLKIARAPQGYIPAGTGEALVKAAGAPSTGSDVATLESVLTLVTSAQDRAAINQQIALARARAAGA